MNPRRILFPEIRLVFLPAIIGYGFLGAIIAGLYGIVHDQVTYSISEEYFTRLKFIQFAYADAGFPRRVFVGEIGFLATWWVGFVAGWFISRITVPAFSRATAFRYNIRAFLIMFSAALLASLTGYALGLLHGQDFSNWEPLASSLGVKNVRSFVRVAYIHNSSYLGGLVGLIIALLHLKRLKANAASHVNISTFGKT